LKQSLAETEARKKPAAAASSEGEAAPRHAKKASRKRA
jgi:hypothetical protein